MTGLVIFAIAVAGLVALLAFDWARTQRIKKSLAAGGQPPPTHTGAHPTEGVSANTQAQHNGNTAGGQSSGFSI